MSKGYYVCPYCGLRSDYPLNNHNCPFKPKGDRPWDWLDRKIKEEQG